MKTLLDQMRNFRRLLRVSFQEIREAREAEPQNLRLYRSSPESLTLQLRGTAPLTSALGGKSDAKPRHLYTSATIGLETACDLRDALHELIQELEGKAER